MKRGLIIGDKLSACRLTFGKRQNQHANQTPDENILRMERLLNNYASMIEFHVEYLKSLANDIQGLKEMWQEYNERVSTLDCFVGSLKGTPITKRVFPA